MIRYLLDTNAISELRKGERADRGMLAWFDANDMALWALSVVTIGEIRFGIEKVRASDLIQAHALERWLGKLERNVGDRILPVTVPIANTWGSLMHARSMPNSDGWIAATALEHDLTVVTRNVADFQRSGARLLNPFSAARKKM